MITEEEFLTTLSWEDIAIVNYMQLGYMLVLICKDGDRALRLYQFLTAHLPLLRISMDTQTHKFTLHFFFDGNTLKHIKYATGKSAADYPPLKILGSGNLKHLSTGILKDKGRLQAYLPITFESSPTLN